MNSRTGLGNAPPAGLASPNLGVDASMGRSMRRMVQEHAAAPSTPHGADVVFRVRTFDLEVPLRLMATRLLMPGLRRTVDEDAVIVYLQTLEPALSHMPRIYDFMAQFSADGAAFLAGVVASDLQGTDAVLEVQRVEVPIRAAVIAEALLSAADLEGPGSPPSRSRRRPAASGP
jgi:hypothetical protein